MLRFSVGFGKPLWSRRVGPDGMELAIGAFPLGGYVKMLDEAEGDVPASELHRAFNRQRVWKRMAIVVAGPLFNFIFAILAYWAIYMAGVDGIQPVIGKVAEDSIAQQAGRRCENASRSSFTSSTAGAGGAPAPDGDPELPVRRSSGCDPEAARAGR